MSNTPGLGLLYSSYWSTQSPISAANTSVVSDAFGLGYSEGGSIQIKSDGGAAINYTLQVTDIPERLSKEQFGSKNLVRDDSLTSTDWEIPTNGSGTITAGPAAGVLLVLNQSKFLYARLILTYASGGSANAYALIVNVPRAM